MRRRRPGEVLCDVADFGLDCKISLERPDALMIEPWAPVVVDEVRLQQRRQIETGHAHLLEFIDLFWIENIFSLGCPPSLRAE